MSITPQAIEQAEYTDSSADIEIVSRELYDGGIAYLLSVDGRRAAVTITPDGTEVYGPLSLENASWTEDNE